MSTEVKEKDTSLVSPKGLLVINALRAMGGEKTAGEIAEFLTEQTGEEFKAIGVNGAVNPLVKAGIVVRTDGVRMVDDKEKSLRVISLTDFGMTNEFYIAAAK